MPSPQELLEKHSKEFETLYSLYEEYNSHTNISAIRNKEEAYEKHFADSLTSFDLIFDFYHEYYLSSNKTFKIIDIGTGAGFPALPLAIAFKDYKIEILALDSVGKKIKFIEQAIKELGLKNITAKTSRAEDLVKEEAMRGSFQMATSRAVAYMNMLLEISSPFLYSSDEYEGKCLLYKKLDNNQELADAKSAIKTLNLRLDEQIETAKDKQFIILSQKKACPIKYPRNGGIIKKKPL